jgi:cohesin domain-containing protein/dockerin type I repeat protein
MVRERAWIRRAGGSALGFGVLLALGALFVRPASSQDQAPVFLRGDANADGRVSLSDAMLIRKWSNAFNHNNQIPTEVVIPCLDTADADDNGWVETLDSVVISCELFYEGSCQPFGSIRSPFPQVGPDTTADGPEQSNGGNDLGCASYDPHPQEATDDLIRLGEFSASPGQQVEIPVYLTNSRKVLAIQLVIGYDAQVLSPIPGTTGACKYSLDFQGSAYEALFDTIQPIFPTCRYLGMAVTKWYPDQGFFTVGIVNSFMDPDENYEARLPEGDDRLVFKIRAMVSANAAPGTSMTLDLTNGPDGEGVRPPYFIRNELTYENGGSFVSTLPQRMAGKIAIVDDIIFFIRGDANRDGAVDISDPISVIEYLYLGGPAPTCMDAADADDNGQVELTDAVVVLSSLFLGTAVISQPYPSQGADLTSDDALDCKP